MAQQLFEYQSIVSIAIEVRDTGNGNALTDINSPNTLTFYVEGPCLPQQIYVWGTDVEVRRTATGKYVLDLYVDEPGVWSYVAKTEGTIKGSQSGTVTVGLPSPALTPDDDSDADAEW